LLAPPLAGGQRVLRDIRVYPPHEGIYLITFVSAGRGGNEDAPRYAYAKTPLDSQPKRKAPRGFLASLFSRPPPPAFLPEDKTILDYLGRISAGNPGIDWSYLWWMSTGWRYLWFLAGGALVVGGIWPLIIRRLVKAGYGPRIIEEPKYDLDRFAPEPLSKPEPSAKPKATELTPQQLQHLRDLEAEVAQQLSAAASQAATAPSAPQAAPFAPVRLSSEPLQPLQEAPKEQKTYRGEFYPTERGGPPKPKGFTIVELLIVIGVIGMLIAILLPALAKARQAANAIACAANLRSIGQGMAVYLLENQGTYPASYIYIGQSIENGVETPGSPVQGYQNWSSYLYGAGAIPLAAFTCPSMHNGGLPPTDTTPNNLDPGQVTAAPGVVDQQAPRLAYTLNEAICPRNKWVIGFQGSARVFNYVKATQITNTSGTILGTEWIDNGLVTSAGTADRGWIYSHRPLDAFVGLNGELDIWTLPPGSGFRRVTVQDLDPDPLTETTSQTRLDWVGRNHGIKQGYPDRRQSNFLYVDGHVVTKTVYETLSPFEWGDRFFSLDPNGDMVNP
jgi:prepilin-type N-terminal cleavage/methylation domain-containing protein/prepilin-type processing-associated H-X9-DG protein